MDRRKPKTGRAHSLRISAVMVVAFGYAPQARAISYLWDENGTGVGFGMAGASAINWSSSTSLFTAASDGATNPSGSVATTSIDNANFGNGTLGLSAGNITVSGTVAIGTINFGSANAGTVTLSGGTITLSGNIANSYAGTSGISSTLDLNGANRTFGSVSSSGNLSIGTIVNGTGTAGIVIDRAGKVTLTGQNIFNGNVQIGGTAAAGTTSTLSVSSLGNQGSTTSNLGSGTTINLGALTGTNSGVLLHTGGGETSDRLFTASGSGAAGATINASGNGLLKLTGTFTSSGASRTLALRGSGSGEYNGSISDGSTTLALTKADAGTWTLSASNSFKGTTTVSAGTLLLRQNNALGSSAVTLSTTAGVGSGLLLTDGAYTVANAITASSSGTAIGGNTANTSEFGGTITVGTGGFSVSQVSGGTLNLTNSIGQTGGSATTPRVITFTNDGDVAVSGNIGGGTNLAVVQSGGGTTTLSGNNAYGATGTNSRTTINAGTLVLAGANTITGGSIVFGGGTLRYGGSNTTDYSSRIASGTSAGAIAIDTNGAVVTFGTSLTSNQSGGLLKKGPGTLSLTASNAYTGGTIISGGTLRANATSNSLGAETIAVRGTGTTIENGVGTGGILAGTGATGDGTVTVSGITLGTIGGTITGGTGATSTDAPGTLSTRDQVWNPGGTHVNKFATSAGSVLVHDLLSITGTLSLNGLTASSPFVLKMVSTSAPTGSANAIAGNTAGTFTAGTYLLASTTGGIATASGTAGANADLTGLFVLNIDGVLQDGNYTVETGGTAGGGSNNLYLTVTQSAPEPTTAALVGLGASAVLGHRRRPRVSPVRLLA